MRNHLLKKPHLTTLGQFLLLFSLLLPVTAFAQFTQLVNIPGLQGDSINDYVRALFYIAIGIAAMLAVVKLVIAGAKYMLSDVANTKQTAIADIRGAIFGLLLILATVLILNTISQNIVETDVGGGLPEIDLLRQEIDLSDRFNRIGDMCTPETGGENLDGVRCEMERCSATRDLTGDTIGFIRSCQERCDDRENSVFVPDVFLGGECYWPNPTNEQSRAEELERRGLEDNQVVNCEVEGGGQQGPQVVCGPAIVEALDTIEGCTEENIEIIRYSSTSGFPRDSGSFVICQPSSE